MSSKTGKARRAFLPAGLTDMLRAYLEPESRSRAPQLKPYLTDVRRRVVEYDRAGRGPRGRVLAGDRGDRPRRAGHRRLFVNGEAMPIRRNNNLPTSLRADMRKARVDSAGLDPHALRYTCNTTMVRAAVNPAVVRARMGHRSARMTDPYTDVEALDRGGHTEASARLFGALSTIEYSASP